MTKHYADVRGIILGSTVGMPSLMHQSLSLPQPTYSTNTMVGTSSVGGENKHPLIRNTIL